MKTGSNGNNEAAMTLAELLTAANIPAPDSRSSLLNVTVTGVAQDSQRLLAGQVFVARRGMKRDAHTFVPQVIARGAVAIVGSAKASEQRTFAWHGQLPYIYVPDDRLAIAQLAAAFHGHPSRHMHVSGVTGTDGKTTTSFMLHHLLVAKHKSSLLSTAGIRIGQASAALEGHFTTPEASEVQRLLAQFRAANSSHVVLESSSHGLALKRLAEVDYDVAVWTNLTPEHLDFHGTFAAYRQAKLELMRRAKTSIINAADDNAPWFIRAATEAGGKVVRYAVTASDMATGDMATGDMAGQNTPAVDWPAVDSQGVDWQGEVLEESPEGLRWRLLVPALGVRREVFLPMVGRYNVANALAALAAASQTGLEVDALCDRLETFSGVAGRMERVLLAEVTLPFNVIVDFAHTPDSLRKALRALRPQTKRRLIVVIGAAGERDPGKRSGLASVALQDADYAVFTEEDSRSEDIHAILQTMADAAAQLGREGQQFVRIANRHDAISHAINYAQAGDTVLLAGKGHETSLERADAVLDWHEVDEAQRALNVRFNR
jgi:UDP-N-acetylmuramoyl-L-alanyl-D-glutamate--2,6-diaminopimelate ligase